HFSWLQLDRQVLINGRAELLTEAENEEYFCSRPRPSQLAALASRQSQPIASRQVLDDRYAQLEHHYADADVALPDFWGGYRIVPTEIEFWQGGERRLHDRFRYSHSPEQWLLERLSP
ncbi:MAG: pyridoxamine 5'-phosphate oxidase, partial [Paraglaciecola psychrophila]